MNLNNMDDVSKDQHKYVAMIKEKVEEKWIR